MNAVLFYEELCLALKILLLVSLWELFKMILPSSKVVTGIMRCSRYTRLGGVNVIIILNSIWSKYIYKFEFYWCNIFFLLFNHRNCDRSCRMRSEHYWNFAIWSSKRFRISKIKWHPFQRRAQSLDYHRHPWLRGKYSCKVNSEELIVC